MVNLFMQERINEKVSAALVYDKNKTAVYPLQIFWQGKTINITKVGFHHFFREGRVAKHIFSVTDGSMAFRLAFNTEDLSWTLEEVNDGN